MKTYDYRVLTTEGEYVLVDMDDDGIFTDDTGEVYFDEDIISMT